MNFTCVLMLNNGTNIRTKSGARNKGVIVEPSKVDENKPNAAIESITDYQIDIHERYILELN